MSPKKSSFTKMLEAMGEGWSAILSRPVIEKEDELLFLLESEIEGYRYFAATSDLMSKELLLRALNSEYENVRIIAQRRLAEEFGEE